MAADVKKILGDGPKTSLSWLMLVTRALPRAIAAGFHPPSSKKGTFVRTSHPTKQLLGGRSFFFPTAPDV